MWFFDRLSHGVGPRRFSAPAARARRRGPDRPGPTQAERLEQRLLFVTSDVGEQIVATGPANQSTYSSSVSDGAVAYYYGQRQGQVVSLILRTDGTLDGTRRIGEVPLGTSSNVPTDFTLVGERLFFLAPDAQGSSNAELYTYDPVADEFRTAADFGGPGGTVLDPVALGGRLFFLTRAGAAFNLWSTDGTNHAHVMSLGDADSAGVPDLARVGDYLYFGARAGASPWSVYRTDGGPGGPQHVATIPAGNPGQFVAAGGNVVFNVRTTDNTLWVTDGTAANTRSLAAPGGINFLSAGEFAIYTGTFGSVFRTDGTGPGTAQLAGLRMPPSPAVFPAVTGGAAYVPSDFNNVRGLFRVTTTAVTPVFDGGTVAQVYAVGDRVYFSGSYQTPGGGPLDFHQNAVMVSDGTPEGTWILEDRLDGGSGLLPNTFRRTSAGVIYGLAGSLTVLPVDAPGLAKFSGRLFRDLDRDGVYDPGEPRETLAALTPERVPNIPVAADGTFSVLAVPPNTTAVTARTTADYVRFTTPSSRPLNLARGQANPGMDFGFERINIIRGLVRHDANLDDVALRGEPPAPGHTVVADLDRDGTLDAGEPSAVSGADGAYELSDVPAGELLLRVRPLDGWYQSAPIAPGIVVSTTAEGGIHTPSPFGVTDAPPRNYVTVAMFEDGNRNGVRDDDEPRRRGGVIWADLDDDGAVDAGEPSVASATTDVALRLPGPGTYRLRAQQPAGWVDTAPPPVITLSPGERRYGVGLPVALPAPAGATIAGTVFGDVDGDGVHDPAETPNALQTVYLDDDLDFARDANEPTVVTDSAGRFVFANLPAGHYSVRLDLGLTSHTTTPPPGEAISVELAPDQQRLDLLFGIRTLVQSDLKSLSGFVYHDANLNQRRDNDEGAFTGRATVYIDHNNNGVLDQNERSAGIGFDGNYLLPALAPGRYRVRVAPAFQFPSPFRISTFDEGDSAIVQVGNNPLQNFLAIGAYFPNTTVGDAWIETHRLPLGVYVELRDVSNGNAIRDGVRVTGPGGVRVFPSRVRFNGASNVPNSSPTMVVDFDQPLPAGQYTLTIPGAALKGSPGLATPPDFTFTFQYPPPPSRVVGRHVFYDHSGFDLSGTNQVPNERDPANDLAIATDKRALLPGEAASFANLTSYGKGINGVMIDVAGLPRNTQLRTEDFVVRAGTSLNPNDWQTAGLSPVSIGVRRGAGVGGSDRIALLWHAGALKNTWVQITIKPSTRTGLDQPDVFYFGNLAGDTGGVVRPPRGAPARLQVDANDAAAVRRALGTVGTTASSPVDVDRSRGVTARDVLLVRANHGRGLQLLSAGSTATPTGPDLLPESDSGISNADDVTTFNNDGASRRVRFVVANTVPGATVRLFIVGGPTVGTAVATGTTTVVTADDGYAFPDGVHTLIARQTLPDGTASLDSAALTLTVDTAAPSAPPAPDLLPASDTGVSDTDNLTSDRTPTFDVAAGPYYRVYLGGTQISGDAVGVSPFNYNGPELADGTHVFTVSAVDAAGNVSPQGAPLQVTVDDTGPTGVATAANADVAGRNTHTFTVTWTDANGIDVSSLGDGDVYVDGPRGVSLPATLVSVSPTPAASPMTATYRITAPGGNWDGTDAGDYVIRVASEQVRDLAGSFAPVMVIIGGFSSAATGLGIPDLLPESDTGASDSDDLTRNNNAGPATRMRFLVVNAIPGSTIYLHADGILIAQGLAETRDAVITTDGAAPIPDGVRAITARQVPPGEPESPPTPALLVTVKTTAPAPSAPVLVEAHDPDRDGDTTEPAARFRVTVAEAGVIHLRTGSSPGGPSLAVDGPGTYELAFTPDSAGFEAPPTRPNAGGPTAILRTADFNADGRPDLLGNGSGVLTVLLNTGGGDFAPPRVAQVPNIARVFLGHASADNFPDLLVAESTASGNGVSVYLGRGDGTFDVDNPRRLPGDGRIPWAVGAADMNNDGLPDLLIGAGSGQGSSLDVLLANADRTYTRAGRAFYSVTTMALEFADFNRDGKMDVARVDHGSVHVYLGDGAGGIAFAHQPDLLTTSGMTVRSADFNGDDVPDLAAMYDSVDRNGLVAAVGNGDGTFRRAVPVGQLPGDDAFGLAIEDFDRDGERDLVTSYYRHGLGYFIAVAPGNGDGTFGEVRSFPLSGGYYAPAVADFNGDGRLDVATSDSNESSLLLFPGTGGPLPLGPHSVTAWLEDRAGNRSPDGPATQVVVEAPPPAGAAAAPQRKPRGAYRPGAAGDILRGT